MGAHIEFTLGLQSSALRRHWRAEVAANCALTLADLPKAQRINAVMRFDGGSGTLGRLAFEPAKRQARRLSTLRAVLSVPAADNLTAVQIARALQNLPPMADIAVLASATSIPTWVGPTLAMPNAEELRVDFLTPLVYAKEPGRPLNVDNWLALVGGRYSQIFGDGAVPKSLADGGALQVLQHFGLASTGIAAPMEPRQKDSPVAARPPERGSSFAGTLFLRNPSPALVACLCDLQAWHLVAPQASLKVEWRGRFRLSWQHGPWLDRGLLHPRRMHAAAARVLQSEDRSPQPGPAGEPLQAEGCTAALLDQLGKLSYECAPTQSFTLHRTGHAPRLVEKLTAADLIVQQRALEVLGPVAERMFDPRSFGFRLELGRQDAIRAVREALREGFTQVVETDVAHCFASLSHAQVDAAVDRFVLRSDKRLRRLLHQCVRQPSLHDGVSRSRSVGLAQGAPLSPLLCNLVLTQLDASMDTLRWRYVRFADDLLVLTRTRGDAELALQQVKAGLANVSLSVAEQKTRITTLQQGFRFLGEQFSPQTLEPVEAAVAAQRKPLMVTEPFLQLGVNGAALEARRGQQVVGTWPLRRLSGLVIMTRCNLSSMLLERCSSSGVPIAIALRHGKQMAVLVPNQRTAHQAAHCHACWHEDQSAGARLSLAQAVVRAKLTNTMSLLRQRQPGNPLRHVVDDAFYGLGAATTTDALRGHEGNVARHFFRWLQQQVLPAQQSSFQARRRERGTPDCLNSLLNFCYYLLFTRVNALVRLRGLNPYLGWLHDGDDDYETLVYDLMEPFRPFVDRLVLRLINRQELRAAHFDATPGARRLTREGSRIAAEGFERAMGEKVGAHRLRDLIWMQVRAVEELVAGRGPLWLYHWKLRAELPAEGAPQEPAMLCLGQDAWATDDGDDGVPDAADPLALPEAPAAA